MLTRSQRFSTGAFAPRALRRLTLGVAQGVLPFLVACDFGTEPELPDTEIGVVLNSADVTLTVFPTNPDGAPVEIGIGLEGPPVAVAVRGRLAAVPLGIAAAVAVVDLVDRVLVHTVALPAGSGASGAAFLDDSVVLVTNAGLGTLTPVNVLRGTRGTDIPVGGFPVDVIVARPPGCRSSTCDRVVVVNAELGEDLQPAGSSTLTVLRPTDLSLLAQVTLSGENAVAAASDPDGRLYVLHAGRPGAASGSLSVVDLAGIGEASHHTGFGELPDDVIVTANGRVHVAALAYGIAVWDLATGAFLRAPADAVAPEGVASASGLALDGDGQVWSLRPACTSPGAALRLTAALEVERTVPAGTCPVAIAFGRVPSS